VDRGERVDLVRIIEDCSAGKWLGFAAHAEPGCEKAGPRTTQSLGGSPLHKGIAEDNRAVAAEIERPQIFANCRVLRLRWTPRLDVDLAQAVEHRIRIGEIFAHGIHLARKALPILIEP